MKTIHHVVETSAPRERVFSVLTTTEGLSGWWSTSVKAEAAEGDKENVTD